MNKIQCPHCFTDYKISDENLRLSQGVVRCGKCMESFDANASIINKEPVFDPRSAFIEPETEEGSNVGGQTHNSDHSRELAEIRKQRKENQPSETPVKPRTTSEPTRPRVNKSSRNSIKENFDPQLSVDFEDDSLAFIPDENTEDISLEESDTSYVMEPSTALEDMYERYVTEDSIQVINDKVEPLLEEPSIQIEPSRLKSRLQTPITPEKQKPSFSETSTQEPIKTEPTLFNEPAANELKEEQATTDPTNNEIASKEQLEIHEVFSEETLDDNDETLLIDEVDQLIDDKLTSIPEEAEAIVDDGLFNEKKKKTTSRLFSWLILSPIYLLLITLLSIFLIFQLWQKQLISWPDRKDVQALIEPAREPILTQLGELDVEIPTRRNLGALQLLSAKTGQHPTRASTVLLKVSLINRAQIEQPLPWLELSLKDSDGKIISRRSLPPKDYIHNNRVSTDIGPRELKKITIELLSFPKDTAGYELKLLNK